MKSYLENIITLPRLYLSIKTALKFQSNYLKYTIAPEIESIKHINDNSLSEQDFIKINKYYALAVPAILGEAFCLLRNKKMTEQERATLTYLGAATGLFDDFFDKNRLTEEKILRFIDYPSEDLANSSHELLFLKFYLRALKNVKNASILKKRIHDVYHSQILSLKQLDVGINKTELKEITFRKGGTSLRLYRSAMENAADQQEDKMIYQLGSLFQLENDLFDIYKDYQDGICTLATLETKIHHLRTLYLSLLNEQHELLSQTDYPLQSKKKFSRYISLITFRGLVSLDFLEEQEKKTKGVFDIQRYQRKNLICDMEKPSNILKVIHYYAAEKYHF